MLSNTPVIVVDFIEQNQEIINFLYKIFNYNPAIPYMHLEKVKYYHKIIINHLLLNMNNKVEYVMHIDDLIIIQELNHEDHNTFRYNAAEFKLLLLYVIKYLSNFIHLQDDDICLLHTYTMDYIVITVHKLNKEADDLVYRTSGV